MDIAIQGRNLEVPEDVRAAVEEKLVRVTRILSGMERAEVRFREERNPRIADKEVCEVTMHGHGHVVRAHAAAPDPMTAVDLVIDKLSHRLEKLKGKLIGRSHPRRSASLDFERAAHEPGNGTAVAVLGTDSTTDDTFGSDEGDDVEARIVRTKQFAIKPMTPVEAAMQMDLIGHDFYFFTNSETERPAVVYRRNDGDVGLIDSN